MFVLDTNAVIHFFKNKGEVAEHLLATAPGDCGALNHQVHAHPVCGEPLVGGAGIIAAHRPKS